MCNFLFNTPTIETDTHTHTHVTYWVCSSREPDRYVWFTNLWVLRQKLYLINLACGDFRGRTVSWNSGS